MLPRFVFAEKIYRPNGIYRLLGLTVTIRAPKQMWSKKSALKAYAEKNGGKNYRTKLCRLEMITPRAIVKESLIIQAVRPKKLTQSH
ncbi:MAG: hypothetical protein PHP57_04225 [Sideroxydans sp.]|nr:hypothetical protein [Sideroxydans sp.]